MVCIKGFAQRFRIGNLIRNLAVIEIRCEDYETGLGQPRAESLDRVVQPPPGMQNQYPGSLAGGRDSEKAWWLSVGLENRLTFTPF